MLCIFHIEAALENKLDFDFFLRIWNKLNELDEVCVRFSGYSFF